jgi:hypothetical protein
MSRTHVIALGAALLSTIAVTSGIPGTQHPAAAATSICSTEYNPFAKSTATLRACGDAVYPLQRAGSLAGGGKSYTYSVNGTTITYDVPPPGFNPLKASDAQLQEYNLPTRAQFGSLWVKVIGGARHFLTPPPFLVALPNVKAALTNDHWSGFMATHHNYTSAFADYREPRTYASSCRSTSLVEWAGLGGWNTGDLAQDGTAISTPGAGNHQSWIEVLPLEPFIIPQPLYATRGYEFNATTTWHTNPERYSFYMVNTHTGDAIDPVVRSHDHDPSTAEVITERPLVNGVPAHLSNYRKFFVGLGAATWGTKGAGGFFQVRRNAIHMVDGSGHTMSLPGAPLSIGSWYMYQRKCN